MNKKKNRFAAKVMGAALTVPMILGGTMVFADEVETQGEASGVQIEESQVVNCLAAAPVISMAQTNPMPGFTEGETYNPNSQVNINGKTYVMQSIQDDYNGHWVVRYGVPYHGGTEGLRLEFDKSDYDMYFEYPTGITYNGGSITDPDSFSLNFRTDSMVCTPLFFESAVEPLEIAPQSMVCDPLVFYPEAPVAPKTDYSWVPVDVRMASIKNFIGHMYLEGLGRNIEDGAMDYWVDKLFSEDITGTDIAVQILTSKEFSQKNLTDEEFVAVLNNVFGIKSTDDAQVLDALSQGASRESVIEQYAQSSDWAAKCAFYYVNV